MTNSGPIGKRAVMRLKEVDDGLYVLVGDEDGAYDFFSVSPLFPDEPDQELPKRVGDNEESSAIEQLPESEATEG